MDKFVKGTQRHYANMQVNPCQMCMPMGGSMALKGIHGSMTIIHGSQGCSTYIRRHMAAHYNEPVDIASSSLSEEGTVYGGAANLKAGIKNMIDLYKPEVVGVLTSCLAETIGDDIDRIVKEVRATEQFEDMDIIPIPTPGYGGSQSEGYFATVRALVAYYANKGLKQNVVHEQDHVNIIVSNATCEDIRELKRIVKCFGINAIFIPDISDVLDAPYTPNFNKIPEGGTTREELMEVSFARATIELGDLVADKYSPALYLEEQFDVPAYRMPVPIGVRLTDKFVETLSAIYHLPIPPAISLERGRLLDAMIDGHKHSATGKVAIFGDMDLVLGVSHLMAENGVQVKVAATGSTSKKFRERMGLLEEQYGEIDHIMQDSDFDTIRLVIKESDVNLMLGTSDGKFIWEKDGIDLIRMGFPVHDHVGAQRRNIFGYKGASRLLDRVNNTLLDQKHHGYRNRILNTYHPAFNGAKED